MRERLDHGALSDGCDEDESKDDPRPPPPYRRAEREQEGGVSDHELLRARACIEELLKRGAHLQLDPGHGHPRGVSTAQDEHDERPDEDESAEERADAHGGREDLAHLSEDARRRVELPIKDIKALHERNRHEHHRQDKGQLDPAEDVELEEIARIDERA